MFASWRKHFSIVLLLVMGMAGASAAQAVAPPNIITYQGRILNTNGVPVSNTSLSMKFYLYNALAGGTCLWSNSSTDCNSNTPASTTSRAVSLTTGLFTQNLGDTGDSFAAIGSTIFGDNAAVYLEVDIAGETLTPRRRLTAAPYALNAQTLDGLSSADFDLDRVYDNDSSSALAIDGASGLTFTSSVAANFTINLASTGDFVIQDNGSTFATFDDSGNVTLTGDLSILGDDLTMGTNTLGALLVADGTNFNPVVLSGDATISAAGVLAIATNSIALTTDTTGNYVASIADAGNSTVTVVNGSAEGGAVTLNVIDVNCTDCLGATEISDIYLLNSGDTITSDLTFSNGTTDSPNATFSPATGTSWLLYVEDAGDDFQILTNTASTETLDILNGGAGVINVTIDGGATLGGDLTITGDDLTMGTNTSGFFLVADGTNYNPVALSGDATLASTGALTIAADSVALSTDTTGNYVASTSTSVLTGLTGGSSGSEGAALSLAFDYSQALSGDVGLSANAGVFGTSGMVFEGSTADTIETFLAITDPTASDKTITIPNLTGTMILSGHTFTGDVSATLGASNTTALTIAADSVALSTDTTGNYVATLADAGGSDFTIANSGSEGAAVTIDLANDAVDWDEIVDAMTLDASTSITMDGVEDFSIVNGGTGGVIVNLTSNGDFMVQDNSAPYFTVNDDSTIDIISTATTGDTLDITANSLTTAAAIDLDASHAPTAGGTVTAVDFGLTNAATTTAATYRGLSLSFTNNPSIAGNTEYLLNLSNAATANITDNAVAAMIRVDNADTSTTGSTAVSDGILISVSGAISEGIVDAIDASDANITNALNIGANDITGTTGNIDLTNFDVVGSTGNVTIGGDLTVSGDDLTMGTNTLGALLVADGLNFNPVVLSGDATISAAGALAIATNSVALSTDTTGNYVATLADAGGSDFTVSGSGSEGAAVTIDLANDAIDFDEMVDALALDSATSITGTGGETFLLTRTAANASTEYGLGVSFTTGIADGTDLYRALVVDVIGADHTGANNTIIGLDIAALTTGDADALEHALRIGNTWDTNLMFNDTTTIIRLADTGSMTFQDPNSNSLMVLTDNSNAGDLSISGDLTITGDDLFMGTNTSGFILVADGTNYNPVAISGDMAITSAGALTVNDDALDFSEFQDTLDLDAATDINLGANLFSIDLDSTGDFAIRDGTTNVALFEDDSTIDITFPAAAFLTIDASTTANSNTTGVIDLNVSAADAAVDALNIQLTQNNGATGGTQATGVELSLEGNDADGDMFGIRVTSTATTNAAAGTYDALLVLTNNENTAGAVTDAIRITSGAGTAGSITTGLDFDTTDITTDIEFQNGATLANDTDSNLAFVENSLTLNLDFSEVASTIQLETGSDFDIDGSADGEDAIEINASAGGINILASNAADGEDIDIIATGSSVHISSTQAATDAIVLDSSTNASGIILIAGDNEVDGPGVDGNDIALRAEDDVIISPTAGGQVIIDAATDVDSTLSSQGVLQLQVDTSTNANNGFVIDYQSVADAGADNLFAQSILLTIDNDASATDTVVGLYVSSSNFDVSGTGTGIRIEKAETTATGDADMSVGLHLVNIDTDADAGGADQASDISNGIYFESTPGTTGGFVYGLNFDNADITTAEIVFENGDTLANQTDGTFTFGRDTNAAITLLAADSSGATDLTIDTTGAGGITLGSGDVKSITLTTDNDDAGDVGITGGLTVTSGATHNSFTVTSSADTETGAVVTANSLTTGKGLSVTSSSTGFTSGTLLDVDYDASGSLSAKTTTFAEITNGRANTATSGTLSDNYDLVKLSRSSTQSGAGTFSSVGSVLYVENVVAATAGTINDTANGIEVVMDADGTGHGMIITMGTVAGPAANGVNNQGLVIDVNEGTSADAVFLIRSDADGVSVDTEFRIDNDGDFQYDGTASTPASDLAEVYPSAQALAPGDLVALDSTGGLKITKTTTAFQGGLFGAISTKPAIRMGADVIGYDVALIGRIPLKISGEAGAITVGDPLTSSSTVGHAMKATRAGMIVGYALEGFDGTGTGVIDAFIDVGWFAGNVIGTDGLSTILTDAVVVAPLGRATASVPTFDSFGLSLRGSAWNGNEAAAVEMMLRNVVTSPDEYRLSVRNTAESEVAYITNEGTMRIAGDMVVGGRLYPSDRGVPQTEKYIYYDGSAGSAGDFMRTNAKGWSTGSYDFAEMFSSAEKLIAGELVAFAQSGQAVRRATGVAGERVAGIVSTRPGFLAGENVEGSYPIALAGRVPTKVSAQNGNIVVGDPLAISASPGVAMKASDAGQIVGYALESYTATDSDNLILAFVNVGYWSGGPQTVTIVQNVASQAPSGAQNVSALNMSGNIFLATNEILSIGRLEGMGASWSIERDGTIKTQALVKTVIESYQGTKVETIAVTSPEAVITLTGTAKLVEGKAELRFEDVLPEFNDVISAIAPVRVIVTPSGPVSLYVSEKDQNHFVVQRFVGEADVEFDWMVTGYRKGYEPEEAEEESPADEVSDLFVPSVPSDLLAPVPSESDAPIQEEPATPESPEETLVDPATDDDVGEPAQVPSEVVDDQIIDPMIETLL